MKCEVAYLEVREKNQLFGPRIEMTDVSNGTDSLLNPRRSRIEEQNYKLEEAKRLGYETVGTAQGIQTNLKGQSDSMEKNIRRLKETNDELSWSNNMISIMNRRIWKNKMICWFVMFIVSGAVCLIVYSYV